MLVGAQSNFIAANEIFYYAGDLIFILVGLELRRFTEKDLKYIARFSGIYIAYMVIRFVFLTRLAPYYLISDLHFMIKQIYFSFLYCAVMKEKSVYYIVKMTYYGAAISLFFFCMQLVSGSLVYSIGKFIGLPPRSFGNTDYTNFLIFSYDKGHPHQNAGFTWEPGAYGCFLNVGLLFYFILNKYKFDKKVIVFIVAIITTFSTTGYLVLMINLLLYYRVNGGKLSRFIIIGVPILAVAFVKLPFLIDKIGMLYNSDMEIMSQIKYLDYFYKKYGGTLPLNRFGSVIYLYNTFGYRLIWGISNGYQGVNTELVNINISNGDIDFITKFGFIGFCFLLYRLVLFLKRFLFKFEYLMYCILIVVMSAFGEPMLIFQLSLAFLFFYHYVKPLDEPDEDEIAGEEDEESEPFDSYSLINSP